MNDVRVFINYRRRDTRHVAGRLRDRIVSQFGADAVFVDVESIVPGQDYVEAIDSAVSRCTVMCVLIGETWLRPDADGVRRIDDEDDRLRLEIEAGLRHRTVVIPVLVDEATMPLAEELPASIEPLARHQAVRVRYDSFTGDSDRLLTVIGRIAAEQEQDPGQSAVQTPVEVPHLDTTPPTRRDRPSVVRRTAPWVTVGTLVLAVLYLLGTSGQMGDVVTASRHDLPPDGPWGTVVWLLPVLPVGAAALLCVARTGPGLALGCIAGAALWVFTSLVLVVARASFEPRGQHLVLLVLLVVAAVALLAGDPRLRAGSTADHVRPALLATVLLLAAMGLRGLAPWLANLLTGTPGQPFDAASFSGNEAFWLAVLTPVLVCGPVIVAELSLVQLRALVTVATLQVLYPFLLRTMMFSAAAQSRSPLVALVDDLLFLAGSMCMLSSVRTAQLRKLQHGVQALAGGAPVPR